MAYVITQSCCGDASCVAACPVNCIHPAPQEAGFATAPMLYIEPDVCIDCGACVDECPVDAIFPDDSLPAGMGRYPQVNAGYYTDHPLEPGWLPYTPAAPLRFGGGALRVAVVGTGPAALYAVRDLLARGTVEVEVFDRLPTPFGLMRSGVAPDHPATKRITDVFRLPLGKPACRLHLNVEVGKHLSHEELLAHHHAVVYAVGAAGDRRLGIPGEGLPGSCAATEFVAWYNGHPDYADRVFDLSHPRAVVVGNGNVALDVARILVADPAALARTDIADHALRALRGSKVEEVLLLGRRGAGQAAYSVPEFLALGDLPGVDVVLDPADLAGPAAGALDRLKLDTAREFAARPPRPGHKRIVFRFLSSPVEVLGDGRVTGVRVGRNELVDGAARPTGEAQVLQAGMVLRSIGYRGVPVPGVPFDERRGVVPHDRGRVAGAPGVYVAGWIKRGPSGVIGTNRACAHETVDSLVEDAGAGRLTRQVGDRDALAALVAARQPDAVDLRGWRLIDEAEVRAGKAAGRPRVKTVDRAGLVALARGR